MLEFAIWKIVLHCKMQTLDFKILNFDLWAYDLGFCDW